MRKFTQLMLTLALLVVGVGGGQKLLKFLNLTIPRKQVFHSM